MSVNVKIFHSKTKPNFINLKERLIFQFKNKIILFFLYILNLVQKYSDTSQFEKHILVKYIPLLYTRNTLFMWKYMFPSSPSFSQIPFPLPLILIIVMSKLCSFKWKMNYKPSNLLCPSDKLHLVLLFCLRVKSSFNAIVIYQPEWIIFE